MRGSERKTTHFYFLSHGLMEVWFNGLMEEWFNRGMRVLDHSYTIFVPSNCHHTKMVGPRAHHQKTIFNF